MMIAWTSLLVLVALPASAFSQVSISAFNSTCNLIKQRVSSASSVYFPGSPQYDFDIEHFASSSFQFSTCSVEPGSAEDVGTILQILGSTKTQFAIKGGGHSFNPHFSSTTGVQISMVRFNEINVDSAAGTVEIGTGLIGDEVYSTLDAQNLTIVGGRVTGVGLAGFILGGGFSYKTSEYGIALESVVGVEVVLPNGTVTTATETVHPDLLFAIKGTQNNFGIVTKITMKAIPQGLVWGGYNVYPLNSTTIPAIALAASNFANNVTDPKAGAVFIFNYANQSATLACLFYYNGLTPAPGVFDELLSIPALLTNVSTRSYTAVVQSSPANATINWRSYLQSVMALEFNEAIMLDLISSVEYWGVKAAAVDPVAQVAFPVEPFLPGIFSHGDPGAWPPSGQSSVTLKPVGFQYNWLDPNADAQMFNLQTQTRSDIVSIFARNGQNVSDLPLYPNYARFDTPIESIYATNIPKLQHLKSIYDPYNVMNLTGGWKIPV